ncbi:alpha/beta hydrolase [Candidatus Kuenenbacteria bacterium]|nr:alpha/beta hydrolase [Candidatus Kuenenbacteria bacterium]
MKIIIKNIAIEYSDEGEGPVILFLHGWKDNLHSFDSLVPILSQQCKIIRIDLPGFGNSELPQTTWNLDNYVQFVKDFIDKLNIQVDALIGHSFGGRIAIKAVALNIIKPKKLILIASAGIAKTRTIRNCFFYIFAKAGKMITLFPPFIFWRKQLRKKLYNIAKSDYFLSGKLKNTFLNVIKEDLTSFANKIIIPTLLIWGDQDKTIPLEEGRSLSKLICNSKLEIIINTEHFVHQENPQKVAEIIQKFIL